MGRKPARCKLCQHTTEMHVIDKDGTVWYVEDMNSSGNLGKASSYI